jgi:signal transduction histidine kinase
MKLTDAPASVAEADDPGQPNYPGLARRPSVRVIAVLWAVIVLAAMAGVGLTVVARGDLARGDLASNLALAVATAAYATLGALIIHRAGNVIGWIMLGAGAAQAFLAGASMYAVIGLKTFPGSLPAARQVDTLAECSFPAVIFTVAFMFLLFPAGVLPSRRWRPVAAAGLALAALTTAGLVVHPRLVALPAPGGASLSFPNPLAMSDLGPILGTVLVGTVNGLSAVFLPFLAAAIFSLAVRYRAGGRRLRQQIKWLALTAAGFLVPGPVRPRRCHGGPAGPRRGRRGDGVGPGRCDRGRPGRGVDPGRHRTAPGRDLAARIAGVRRRHDRRRRRPPALREGIARGGRHPRRRAARRAVPAQAAERAADQHRDELMRHLASQAGLVLRNAALTAELRATIDELRASRRRLVEAQDAERRKIERNLHDGAQQQLIALTIHLALLEECAADPAAVRELASAVKEGVRAALDDLRDLARGIYPPLLADQGLVPALQAQALKASLPVEIDADGIGRYPQDAEAAVYFCTLEALQNVTRYANASHATVGLTCSDGSLEFTVTDDGTGFDTANTRHGTGLHGMTDRLAALGGALHVRSQPGHGTILSGRLPLTASGQGLRRPAVRIHAKLPLTEQGQVE